MVVLTNVTPKKNVIFLKDNHIVEFNWETYNTTPKKPKFYPYLILFVNDKGRV